MTTALPTTIDLPVQVNDAKVVEYKNQLDLSDTTSIISWGSNAQKKVGQINSQMLEGVKAKDAGVIGAELTSMVTSMRGLDFSKAAEGNKLSFFGKLLGKVTPIAEFIQSFEEISGQVSAVSNRLEQHKLELLRSVKSLDILYEATLNYYRELNIFIVAGEDILKELDEVKIPELKKVAESGEMMDAQNLNDLVAKRDAFDRRLHDIRLTRQVVMQTLPQIRLVQNNDRDLIQKIDTQIINTIPMWESQLVIAVENWKMAEATKTTKAVSDFQNDLLVKNAELLKQGNAETRKELERGIYDVESVKKANDLLVETIMESIAITQAGREQRVAAIQVLADAEGQLKQALSSAS